MSSPEIPRDPVQPSIQTRRALDLISAILNSLIKGGYIVMTAPGVYTLAPGPAGADGQDGAQPDETLEFMAFLLGRVRFIERVLKIEHKRLAQPALYALLEEDLEQWTPT